MSTLPRLPDPLTPESLIGLMRQRPYWDAMHPRFSTYQRLVKRGFEILYPGPERRDDTGMIVDVKPLPPHQVAHLVAQTNREMDEIEGGFNEKPTPGGEGMVHVQSHVRDGGTVEVADYWRKTPSSALGARDPAAGQGDGRDPTQGQGEDGDTHGAPRSPDAIGDDTLRGQSGEDELIRDKEPPKGAFVAADPEKLAREWSGTRQGPTDEEKRQCVGLVKEAIPEIGPTRTWREGEKIVGPNDPPLVPGTAIATFGKDGKYANISGQSHAAIFLGYDTVDGKQGIRVLDQFGGREANTRFVRFDNPSSLPVNRAGHFAVIKKRD